MRAWVSQRVISLFDIGVKGKYSGASIGYIIYYHLAVGLSEIREASSSFFLS